MLPEHEAKAQKMKSFLDTLVQENKLTSEHTDLILKEAAAHDFKDTLSATEDMISYTGYMGVYSGIAGGYWFGSWGGNFKMHGWMAPVVGSGFFFYARMEIQTKYDYDGCKGSMSFQITPIAFSLNFSMDEKGNVPVGRGVCAGPSLTIGAGAGDFTIRKY